MKAIISSLFFFLCLTVTPIQSTQRHHKHHYRYRYHQNRADMSTATPTYANDQQQYNTNQQQFQAPSHGYKSPVTDQYRAPTAPTYGMQGYPQENKQPQMGPQRGYDPSYPAPQGYPGSPQTGYPQSNVPPAQHVYGGRTPGAGQQYPQPAEKGPYQRPPPANPNTYPPAQVQPNEKGIVIDPRLSHITDNLQKFTQDANKVYAKIQFIFDKISNPMAQVSEIRLVVSNPEAVAKPMPKQKKEPQPLQQDQEQSFLQIKIKQDPVIQAVTGLQNYYAMNTRIFAEKIRPDLRSLKGTLVDFYNDYIHEMEKRFFRIHISNFNYIRVEYTTLINRIQRMFSIENQMFEYVDQTNAYLNKWKEQHTFNLNRYTPKAMILSFCQSLENNYLLYQETTRKFRTSDDSDETKDGKKPKPRYPSDVIISSLNRYIININAPKRK